MMGNRENKEDKEEKLTNSGDWRYFGVGFDRKVPVFNFLFISSDLLSACPLLLQKFFKAARKREIQ